MLRAAFYGLSLALGLAAVSGAQAQAEAQVQVSHLSLTLVDLNPGDGISPSLVWDSSAISRATALAGTMLPSPASTQQQQLQDGAPFALTDLTANDPNASARVLVQRDSIWVSGHADRPVGYLGSYDSYFTARTFAAFFGEFQLSPGTQLVLNFDVAAQVQTHAPHDHPDGLSERVVASYDAMVDLYGTADGAAFQRSRSVEDLTSDNLTFPAFDSLERSVSLTVINDGASWRSGQLLFDVQTYGHSSVPSPVPEPGSLALLACGLGTLPWAVRRRRRPA